MNRFLVGFCLGIMLSACEVGITNSPDKEYTVDTTGSEESQAEDDDTKPKNSNPSTYNSSQQKSINLSNKKA